MSVLTCNRKLINKIYIKSRSKTKNIFKFANRELNFKLLCSRNTFSMELETLTLFGSINLRAWITIH